MESIRMLSIKRSPQSSLDESARDFSMEDLPKRLEEVSPSADEDKTEINDNTERKGLDPSCCALLPNRWKIRIKAIFFLCLLGIPGNFVTIALLLRGPEDLPENGEDPSTFEDVNKTSSGENKLMNTPHTFCHEKLENVLPLLGFLTENSVHYSFVSIILAMLVVLSLISQKLTVFSHRYDLLHKSSYWIEGVSLATIGTVGLIGNTLTLVVLGFYENKSSFNTLLMSLVSADTVLVIFYLFDSAYVTAFKNEEPDWYKYLFPYFWHPLRNICSTACVYMVVAVAAERYHAICHPMRYKPSPLFYLSLVGGISFLVNVSKFFEFELQYTKNGSVEYWTTALNEDARYVVFNSYYECTVSGVVPLLALCYLNFRIYSKIRKSARMKHRYVGGGIQSRCSSYSTSRNHRLKKEEFEQRSTCLLNVNIPSPPVSRPSSRISFHSENDLAVPSFSPQRKSKGKFIQRDDNHLRDSNRKHFQNRKEKSTGILICIILVFVSCHIVRLGIQMYEIFSPTHGLVDYFHQCRKEGKLHVPAIFHILGNLNHLCLVLNSSVNFLIYCCMAKKFRSILEKLFFKKNSRMKCSTIIENS